MKLTIIIPVYNKKRYLSGLLEQVMGQTFRDFECLLIDDGSTDGSGAICDEFANRDTRFRVFHIPNGGASHARNLGLDHARGEYVTFIDGDDSILPNHLDSLVSSIEHSSADLVISALDKVTDSGTLVHTVCSQHDGTWKFSEILSGFSAEQSGSGIFGYCVGKIFARELARDVRFDEGLKLAEDFDFYLNLYRQIDTVHFSDARTYLYLLEAENSTGNTASERIDYLAQLRINLRYRDMLRHRGVWSGENQQIVEERLRSYAHFVLFHTPMPLYRERFDALYQIYQAEDFPLIPMNILGKWLFFCLRHNQYTAARLTMQLYRLARRLRR